MGIKPSAKMLQEGSKKAKNEKIKSMGLLSLVRGFQNIIIFEIFKKLNTCKTVFVQSAVSSHQRKCFRRVQKRQKMKKLNTCKTVFVQGAVSSHQRKCFRRVQKRQK